MSEKALCKWLFVVKLKHIGRLLWLARYMSGHSTLHRQNFFRAGVLRTAAVPAFCGSLDTDWRHESILLCELFAGERRILANLIYIQGHCAKCRRQWLVTRHPFCYCTAPNSKSAFITPISYSHSHKSRLPRGSVEASKDRYLSAKPFPVVRSLRFSPNTMSLNNHHSEDTPLLIDQQTSKVVDVYKRFSNGQKWFSVAVVSFAGLLPRESHRLALAGHVLILATACSICLRVLHTFHSRNFKGDECRPSCYQVKKLAVLRRFSDLRYFIFVVSPSVCPCMQRQWEVWRVPPIRRIVSPRIPTKSLILSRLRWSTKGISLRVPSALHWLGYSDLFESCPWVVGRTIHSSFRCFLWVLCRRRYHWWHVQDRGERYGLGYILWCMYLFSSSFNCVLISSLCRA